MTTEATWLTEARKRLAELPELMRSVSDERAALSKSAQDCTALLNAMRAEARKLRRRLLDGMDGEGGEADATEEARDDA